MSSVTRIPPTQAKAYRRREPLPDDRETILDAVDLVAVWPTLVGPQGRNRQWPCPNPNHAQTGATPPVSIDPEGRLWHCHGCDAGGTVLDALVLVRGCDVAEAFDAARALAGLPARDRRPRGYRPAPRTNTPPPPPREPVAAVATAETPPAHDPTPMTGQAAQAAMAAYLEHRGWSPDAVAAFGLVAVRDRWGNPRVLHPYRVNGRRLWWQARALGNGKPRWMSPKGARTLPYARDLAEIPTVAAEVIGTELYTGTRPVVWVCEGPADVVALWHVSPGIAAIGLPGTANPSKFLPMVAGCDLIVCTDADNAGDKCAATIAGDAHIHGCRTARLRPPEGLDVDAWRLAIGAEALAEQIPAELDHLKGWNR